jgi:hypothetical protein
MASYYHNYPHSPMASHPCPGAPIPPTPHSHIPIIDTVPGATIQPLDLPTDEQCNRWEAWGHSRFDREYVFEPEPSTHPSSTS